MRGITLAPYTGSLRGTLSVPGDKSVSHRAVILGSIAQGHTEIHNFLPGEDCLSTIDCFRKLGIEIIRQDDCVHVFGKGMHGLQSTSTASLSTGNSGTAARILTGILAAQKFSSVICGDEQVNRRPMDRILTPLSRMGAEIRCLNRHGFPPLQITGRPLHGISYVSPVASAQVKSAILCAGLYADSETTVSEPSLSRDHTERMLPCFGASVRTAISSGSSPLVTVSPCQELYGQKVPVPGDISSASYFIAAGLLIPGSQILLRGTGINPTRTGILDICRQMGGKIECLNFQDGSEPTADLLVTASALHGTVIEGEMIPALIDEIPIIAVMATQAAGTTVIRDASELRVKETDRIRSITENLLSMGADIIPTEDGMIIHGPTPLRGAQIHTGSDHRIAMSFAIASLLSGEPVFLDDADCIAVSYPAFFRDLFSLQV